MEQYAMKSSVKLYEPLFTLKEIDEDIWVVDGEIVEMNFKLTQVPFSTRMTVVRFNHRDLWIHSPVHLTQELKSEIDALGNVAHIVAPNKLHYVYMEEWSQTYPTAKVWLTKGLEKIFTDSKVIQSYTILDKTVTINWQSEIEYLPFEGSALIEESVFFHKKSRTLILTDLIENIELEEECSCLHRLLFKIGDNTYPNGHTPRDLRMTFLFNKEIARKCYQQIKSWEPVNVLFAHGKCFIGDAEEKLTKAFFWLE